MRPCPDTQPPGAPATIHQGMRGLYVSDSLVDHICTLDQNGVILSINRAWQAFSAANQGEACGHYNCIGANYLTVCDSATGPYSEEAQRMAAGLRRVLRGDAETFALEYPCHSPQEQRWFLARVTRCRVNPAHTVVAHTNITELKRAKDELQRSRDALIQAQRIAKVGSWTLDLRSQHLEWSAEVHRLFETDPDSFVPSYPAFLDLVHPDDRDRVHQAYTDSVTNRIPYEIEHRLLLPDGRIKHVLERCETQYAAPDGPPIASHGTAQDITERVLAEQSLRLHAKLFTLSNEAILITDANNRIVTVNDAFSRISGYSLQELRGKNPSVLASQRTPPETYLELWNTLRQTDHWQGELWDRAKDGHVYPKWMKISVVRNARGDITHHIASFTDLSEHKAIQARIDRLSHQDPLTGLLNRTSLMQRLDQALLSAQRMGVEVVVLVINLDRFKSINDGLGHQAGDALLIEVGQRLRNAVRESDIVARIGGDEFAIVLTAVDSAMAAGAAIAAKIAQQLENSFPYAGNQLRTTPSIGVSTFPTDGNDSKALIQYADMAMSAAKSKGKNTYRFFSAAMNLDARNRLQVEQDMETALERREFVLHYQPQIDGCNRHICGFEALVRWQHPHQGLVPPDTFIPMAEETGLIDALGAWVLGEACCQLALWKAAGAHGLRMAVNLSAHQLRNPDLPQLVRMLMHQHGLGAGELELEVTESVAMDDPQRAIEQLGNLRHLGTELAIDDFGTGYSSLAYLKRLPLYELKIDKSFVQDIPDDPNDVALVQTILAMAHHLHLSVVAEGVETSAQFELLKANGCHRYQGYHFHRPQHHRDWLAALPPPAQR